MDLSIIIVNYNTKGITIKCLESVLRHVTSLRYEIILVDNASQDGSYEDFLEFAKGIKNIKVISSRKNLGFGGGNNLGLKVAKGRYILLLNSDCELKDNFMNGLIGWMDEHKKVGISSCNLIYPDGRVQGTGGFFPTLGRVILWMMFIDDIPLLSHLVKPYHPMHENSPLDKGGGFFGKEKDLDWVTGAFLIMRREVFDEVGFFDKDYFLYVEEVDYCYRAKKKGWLVYYLPYYKVVHLAQGSSTSKRAILGEYEGLQVFYRKHHPNQLKFLSVVLKVGALVRRYLYTFTGRAGMGEIYGEAYKIS